MVVFLTVVAAWIVIIPIRVLFNALKKSPALFKTKPLSARCITLFLAASVVSPNVTRALSKSVSSSNNFLLWAFDIVLAVCKVLPAWDISAAYKAPNSVALRLCAFSTPIKPSVDICPLDIPLAIREVILSSKSSLLPLSIFTSLPSTNFTLGSILSTISPAAEPMFLNIFSSKLSRVPFSGALSSFNFLPTFMLKLPRVSSKDFFNTPTEAWATLLFKSLPLPNFLLLIVLYTWLILLVRAFISFAVNCPATLLVKALREPVTPPKKPPGRPAIAPPNATVP